jgi:hypothetical protein
VELVLDDDEAETGFRSCNSQVNLGQGEGIFGRLAFARKKYGRSLISGDL